MPQRWPGHFDLRVNAAYKGLTMAKTMNHAAIGAAIASHALDYKGAMERAASCRDAWNVHVLELHSEGIVIGRQGVCPIATAFVDTLVNAKPKGLAKGTADNYLRTLKRHVKSGEPIEDWNPDRKGKGKGKGKGEPKTLATLLLMAYNHEDFESMCDSVQEAFQDDRFPTIVECVTDWLRAQGQTFEGDE
jgi:hypothetical protein